MRKLAALNEEVEIWTRLTERVADAQTLLDLAIADGDGSMAGDIAGEVETSEAELERLEFWLLFSGPHDRGGRHPRPLHAGAGGTEAQDWAAMLLRMYLRWAGGTRLQNQHPGQHVG